MKTILVLTDHSYSSFNAARYALTFAGTFESSKIILYHSYYHLLGSSGEIAFISIDSDSLKEESNQRMEDLQLSLEPFRKANTRIETFTDERQLITAVTDISRDHHIDFIVAGSKNRSALGMLLIGSQIFDLIKNVHLPVLIIPTAYIFEPIYSAVLTTDLLEVEKMPRLLINQFINDYRCRLLVLNVDTNGEESSNIDQILGIGKLHRLLDGNLIDYHYTNHRNIGRGIREFCNEHHAGLIIVIHKEHSFMHKLFYKSVEKEMVMYSDVPVLILNQVLEVNVN